MQKKFITTSVFIISMFFVNIMFSQAAMITWTQTDWSGGDGQPIWSDATKFLSGLNIEYANPGDVKLLIETNYWARTFGGSSGDSQIISIWQTLDGGYVAAGHTATFGAGASDAWVLKFDSAGVLEWQNLYGGSNADSARSIQQTSDGGYIVAGYTYSYGAGSNDGWLLKLDSSGDITWQKTYGGASSEIFYSVQETSDGGYVASGKIATGSSGFMDAWVVKLDSGGALTWQRKYGDTGVEEIYSIKETSDGGYIATGWTSSFSAGGGSDAWLLKLDSSGNISWQKMAGGAFSDNFMDVQQTSDGGYIVAGELSFSAGNGDTWLLKLDSSGDIVWQKTYGLANFDYGLSVKETSDGGYIVVGHTNSFGSGHYDAWVLKSDSVGNIGPSCFVTADGSTVPTDTSAVPVNSLIVPVNSAAVPADTVVTPAVSSLSESSLCSAENYFTPASLISSFYDAGTSYTWGPLTYISTTPANTSISFEVSIDGGLTWQTVTDYVTQTFGASQTIAYRATMSNTDGFSTPILDEVNIFGNVSPVVITSPATSIIRKEAVLNGEITATGGTDASERGFQYGFDTSYGITVSETTGSYGIGTFYANISNLSCGKVYHYRAYATNIAGTGYGSDTSFTTSVCPSGGGTTSTSPPDTSPVTSPAATPPVVPPDISPTFSPVTPPTTPPITSPITPPTSTSAPIIPIVPSSIDNATEETQTSLSQNENEINEVPESFMERVNRVASIIISTIRNITKNPTVNIVANVAVVVPAAASLVVLAASTLSGMPLPNYLFYLFVIFSQFLGLARKPRPWGTVYDAVTKRPLPFVRVEILNEQSRKLQSTVTDINGRYGFLVSGQSKNIQIQAYLSKYDFPSKEEPSVVERKLYPNIYRGGLADVSGNSINLDLPMQPREKSFSPGFYFGITSIRLNNLLTSAANVLFVVGATFGIANAMVNPSVISISILALIFLTFILRVSGLKLKPFGLTKNSETNRTLPFGLVTLQKHDGERLNFTVSDDRGRYFLLTQKGNFVLKAFTPSHIQPTRTKEISVFTRKGWISKEVVV